jgi:hypothetical protein
MKCLQARERLSVQNPELVACKVTIAWPGVAFWNSQKQWQVFPSVSCSSVLRTVDNIGSFRRWC